MKKKSNQVQINVRLDRELNESFERVANENGLNKSIVMREMIRRYIKKNGQLDLFSGDKK